jgi:hypothetical protein
MQCRMCSQRLTRPGKLCRECDQELARARAAAASAENLSSVSPLIEAPEAANEDRLAWTAHAGSRPALVAAAFVVGIAAAVALYSMERSRASGSGVSVMIDRDLSSIRPRDLAMPRGTNLDARAAKTENQAQAGDTAAPQRPVPGPRGAARAPERRTTVVFSTVAGNARSATPSADEPPPAVPAIAAAPESASDGFDRVLGLADALENCSHQPIFARVACEYRARARYCEASGASQIPQCADRPPRDYGQ